MSNRASAMGGLLTLFQNKIKDEEVVRACSEMLFKFAENQSQATPRNDPRSLFTTAVPQALKSTPTGQTSAVAVESTNPPITAGKATLTVSEYRNAEGQMWEVEAVSLAVLALDHMCVGSSGPGRRPSSTGKKDSESKISKDLEKDKEVDREKDKDKDKEKEKEKEDRKDKEDRSPRGSKAATPVSAIKGVSSWSKHTPKSILSVVALMEILSTLPKMACEGGLIDRVRLVLQSVLIVLPPKHSETTRRIEKFLSKLHISHPIPVPITVPVPVPVPVPTRGTGAGSGEDPVSTPFFPVLLSRGIFSSRPSSKENSEVLKDLKEPTDTPPSNAKATTAGIPPILRAIAENHGYAYAVK